MSIYESEYENCKLCPRECGVNRYKASGFCNSDANIHLSRAATHFWEEPCISGKNGSGTVFFTNCTLKCVFCQNSKISSQGYGKEVTPKRLSEIFLELEAKGVNNINLVTPTHYAPSILKALDMVKHKLSIPIVMNVGGYEKLETIKAFDGYIDIYLPDLKYKSSELSKKYSMAENYFEYASKAIKEMERQTNGLIIENGIMIKGLIIRHLVLPNCYHDSLDILKWISENFDKDKYLLSLMSQFTPTKNCENYPKLNRRITTFEYEKVLKYALDLKMEGFMQEKSSAKEEYTPPFNLEGI